MKKSSKGYTCYGTYYRDYTHMEAMEHQGEVEDHVLTTMENNHIRKTKEKKIKKMLIEIHEVLPKTILNSIWRKKKQQHCLPKYI
jgi:hypothetical protein